MLIDTSYLSLAIDGVSTAGRLVLNGKTGHLSSMGSHSVTSVNNSQDRFEWSGPREFRMWGKRGERERNSTG